EIPESVKPVPEGSSVPALPGGEDRPPMNFMPLVTGYGAAAAVLALVIGLAILLKDPLYRAWPATALFYDLAGVETPLPGEGLIIERLAARAMAGPHGADDLTIKGSIINLK